MEHSADFLLDLFVMLAAARLLAELCERIHVPGLIGEILAGVLVGPHVLRWVHPGELHDQIAQVGIVFLLFAVGLETRPRDIFRVGIVATLVATAGVIAPFAGGLAVMRLEGYSTVESLFVAAALTATSVGITARVLSDLRVLGHRASRVILGAAVIDDVIGMLVLAVVFAIADGRVSWLRMGLITAEAVLFVVLVAWAGTHVVRRLRGPVHRMRARSPGFAFALILCLGLSVAASRVDLAAIIGAFLAGLAFADHREEWGLEERVAGVSEFLTPFFFVMLGMKLDLGVFTQSGILGLAVLVTIVAILTKFVGCGLGALPLGLRNSVRIGAGMVPRGEVGLIVALMGLQRGVISAEVYAVVLFMVAVTTVIVPFPLVALFRKRGADSGPAPQES